MFFAQKSQQIVVNSQDMLACLKTLQIYVHEYGICTNALQKVESMWHAKTKKVEICQLALTGNLSYGTCIGMSCQNYNCW
jgi:hypothetical protein